MALMSSAHSRTASAVRWLAGATVLGLAAVVSAEPLPFHGGTGSRVVVDVRVNGAGPFPFVVDTASSHTAVTAELAASLGAPRVAKAALSTSTGTAWAAVVRVGSLVVGPVESDDLLVTELPPGALDGQAALGVLGLDVLGARPFTLDYERRELSWPPAAGDGAGGAWPAEATSPVWTIAVQSNGRRQMLVLDSAADGVVLFDRGQWPALSYRSGTSAVESVTGVRRGRAAVLSALNLGRTRLVETPVVVVDGADIDRAHGDGLLPLHLFSRVTFWPRERRVRLERSGAAPGVFTSQQ